jgi:hypothetical protein
MKNIRHWTIGLTLVAILAVGAVSFAGNAFGSSTGSDSCSQSTSSSVFERDSDSDGIPNCNDSDWTAQPADGGGHGSTQGYRVNQSDNRPLDGTGYEMHRAGAFGSARR